ncbi:restriction endonuclease subunit S [Hafnia alvei]|uniref:restriction endonuclease subunit S n=1 Tax=Hafnia alvei TaxID=569 RepID=UPI001F3A78A4|nr:restriction endonuclease subunit S [Hafnia alvei]MCE9873788.1 restriction endonuclease subunit S [Hafnia alvei]
MSLGYIGNSLPAGWETPFLTDLVTPKQWRTISTKDLIDDGYIVYGANGKIGFYSEYTHEYPTLMITCRGATCGNLHISDSYSYINGNAMALDGLPDHLVDIQFLYYALKARGLVDTISGSAQPQITGQGLKKVRVPLPSFSEQKIIADKLDTLLAQVDNTKARLEQIPQILKRFRQAVLAAAVSGKLTEEWRVSNGLGAWEPQKIGDIVSQIESGKSLKCIETPPQEHEYGIVKISAVTWGEYNEAESKTLPNKSDFIETRRVNDGDFLISRANTIELLGAPVIVHKTTKNLMLSDKVLRLVMEDEHKKWLSIFLRSPSGRKEIESRSTGNQLSMRNIGQKALLDIDLPKPPISEQTEIVRRVEQLFAYADGIEKQVQNALERVNNLTQSILAKAFRGELTAQWRAENPDLISGENSAQALLAKIQQQRANTKTAKRGSSKR